MDRSSRATRFMAAAGFTGLTICVTWIAVSHLRLANQLRQLEDQTATMVRQGRETMTQLGRLEVGLSLNDEAPKDTANRLSTLLDSIESGLSNWDRSLNSPDSLPVARSLVTQCSQLADSLESTTAKRVRVATWAQRAALAALMADNAKSSEEQLQASMSLIDVADALPSDAPASTTQIASRLRQQAESLEASARRSTLEELLRRANQPDLSDSEAISIREALIADETATASTTAEFTDRIANARAALDRRVRAAALRASAEAARQRFVAVQRLPDPEARLHALGSIISLVRELQAEAAMDGELTTDVSREVVALSNSLDSHLQSERLAAAKRDDDLRRAYQLWAMAQIECFDRKHDSVVNSISKMTAALSKDKHFVWREEDYRSIRDAMIEYLLPVDELLLQRGVSERFREAWDKGWKLLENDKSLQTDLLMASIATDRRSLSEE